MYMFKLAGLFAIIPTAVLLAISFFVLLTAKRSEAQGLRAFAYVVAAFLWAAALVVLSAGIYTLATGRDSRMCMMGQGMYGPKMMRMRQGMPAGMMHKGMMREQSPSMMQEENN